jgi:hypothetical protein
MCSSPKGSNKSSVNKPRSRGMFVELSPAARLSFANKANAADDRKVERLALAKIAKSNLLNLNKPVEATWFTHMLKCFY